ncbi:MAG: DUF2790 domain-containing protein [Pseudomonas sp.]|uniref:DUF2790 domain-containing protein n=1 Tax=Pseudomonas sp. TaxID=306 RepID=UPI003D0E2A35
MKKLVAVALLAVSSLALADQAANGVQPAVEHYTYNTKLDIAKVISLSKVADVCEVVPATMVYEDHQGQRHTIEYRVMGDGCSQG